MKAPAMDFVRKLPIPKKLSSRLWLITLPSALVSFERQQDGPKLPAGLRLAGIPLIAAGAALAFLAWRKGEDAEPDFIVPDDEAPRITLSQSTIGGLLVVLGAALLLRSLLLALYALGLAIAGATRTIEVEEPGPRTLLGGDE